MVRPAIKGRVVLVPFPFDDLSSTKVRPAVCLTNAVGPRQHVVLAFITSRVHSPRADSDIVLDAGDPDFPTTGLRVSSVLRLHRLMTVSLSLVRRDLGQLSPRVQAHIDAKLREMFEL